MDKQPQPSGGGTHANTVLIDKDTIAKVIDLWERQIKGQEKQIEQMVQHHDIELESNGILKGIAKDFGELKTSYAKGN